MKEVLKEKLEKLIKDFKQSLEFAKSNGVKYEHIQEEYDFYNEIKETIEKLEEEKLMLSTDELNTINMELTRVLALRENDLKEVYERNQTLNELNRIQKDSIKVLTTIVNIQDQHIKELKERINELKYEVEGLVNIAVKDEDEDEVEKVDETLNKIQLIQQLKDLGYEEYNNIGGSIIEFNKEVNDDEINLRIDFKQKKFIKFSDDIDSRIYINHDELMIIDKLFKLEN